MGKQADSGQSSEKDPNVSWDRWITARRTLINHMMCQFLYIYVCVGGDLLCYKLMVGREKEWGGCCNKRAKAARRLSRVI